MHVHLSENRCTKWQMLPNQRVSAGTAVVHHDATSQ